MKAKHILRVAVSASALCAPQLSFAADTGRVEEIVVTAQRRSENLQKVPITVSAIEGKTAEKLGITDTTALQAATPGIVMHHTSNALTPSIRGISSSNAAAGDESPVAVYVDGVYIVAMTSGIFSFNNIERVEVLKGPQGTLFGRNAVGGVVNIITAKPSQTPMLKASIGYGNYGTIDANVYGTMGLTPKVAVDVSAFWHRQYDGWGRNITTGADTFTNKEFGVRNKWLITPSDATDITLSFDLQQGRVPYGTAKDALPGTRVSASNGGGTHIGGFYDIRENTRSDNVFKQWGASATIGHDFDWARIVSISAYRGGTPLTLQDNDTTPLNAVIIQSGNTVRELTQEFHLLSRENSRVKWIVGAFFMHNRAEQQQFQVQPLTAAGGVAADNYITTISGAGFGELTVPVYEKTHFTAGLRWTYDRQHIEGANYVYNTGVLSGARVDQRAQFGKPTWRLALDHQFTPSLMAYFSYNRGFKSGVYNATDPASAAVNPTVIDAYELGMKSQWWDNRLRVNASAFYYDASQVQLAVTVGSTTRLLNAAAAEIKGVDLDVEVIPIERLTLRGALAYTDTSYQNFKKAPILSINPTGGYIVNPDGDGSGNWMIYTPQWSVSTSALYDIPTSIGNYDLAVNYAYTGKYFPDSPNQFPQKATNIVNASATWTSLDDRWNVKLWGKNLLAEEYYNHITARAGGAVASPSPPLTYGITLGMKWGG